MKLHSETSIRSFDAWSGAKETKERILSEGKATQFDDLIDELYPDGLSETHLNDILWFESEWVYEMLGIEEETEEEETNEDEE
jgi:hypothetical protein